MRVFGVGIEMHSGQAVEHLIQQNPHLQPGQEWW
jgi:hypothetical protein